MLFVEELPKNYNPNVYFLSLVNAVQRAAPVVVEPEAKRRNTAPVNYNILQLSAASATATNTHVATHAERTALKRFAELDRENHGYHQDHNHRGFEIPKTGFNFVAHPYNMTGGKLRGVTQNTRRILASRKALSNWLDEVDDEVIRAVYENEAGMRG